MKGNLEEIGSDEAARSMEEEIDSSELAEFEAADIDIKAELSTKAILSVVESVLFSADKPQTVAIIKQAFKGTQVLVKDIKKALATLKFDCEEDSRGIKLEEVAGGYQLRTKKENMTYVQQMIKARNFRLSGPALEVLSLVAYNQPCVKAKVDDVRGVESGHLLRALMNRGLLVFDGKSELPGKPMLYKTTRKFLEIFSLKSISDLPSLREIDQLIPDGIGEEGQNKKESLNDVAQTLGEDLGVSYSQGEKELTKITDELTQISTTSDFFEQEKERMRKERDLIRSKSIQEAVLFGEEVSEKDKKWHDKYEIQNSEQDDSE